MGGSSLAAEVFRQVFGRRPGYPEPIVLDSTDPDQIRAVERRIDPARTLVVVASKSGSTLEPSLLLARFAETRRRRSRRGRAALRRGHRSRLEARSRGARARLPPRRRRRADDRRPLLGAVAVRHGAGGARRASTSRRCSGGARGRDRRPPAGAGRGLGGAARSAPGRRRPPRHRQADAGRRARARGLRRLARAADRRVDRQARGVRSCRSTASAWPRRSATATTACSSRCASAAPSPTATRPRSRRSRRRGGRSSSSTAPTREHLGAEMYRWEIATAVAGAELGVHPFDQPDVEAAKIEAQQADRGRRGDRRAALRSAGRGRRAARLLRRRRASPRGSVPGRTPSECSPAHLARLAAGDYFALLAFLEMSEPHRALLDRLRHRVRDRVAGRRPRSASVRASCTRPARRTRGDPPRVSSCW